MKTIAARDSFLVFGSPDIREEEINEVVHSLRSGWLGTGPKVARFEDDFASYKGVDCNRVAAVNSCTSALHLSMIAAGIGPGDEVITTALTFVATVNAIIHCGATPVLADVDRDTMNINPVDIQSRITEKTKALIPVHMAGRCCDMDAIMKISLENNLSVIEDCAHAIETRWKGKAAGTIGDFGCFSFYVTKNVTTGEGGMILARNEKDIERVKVLALHGLSNDAWKRFSDDGYKHYFVMECGYKYNMMDIQAALGIHQLARVESNHARRKEIWERYQIAFRDLPLVLPLEPQSGTRHAYHLYTLLVNREACGISRNDFLQELTFRKIGSGVHYLSIPEHPFYRERYGWNAGNYPNAEIIGQQTVSIPLSSKLTDTDVEDVIQAVRSIIENR